MKQLSLLIILILNSVISASYSQNFSLTGYAEINAEGHNGTTGGAGGDEITVYSGLELQNTLNDKGDNPLIIYINGQLTYNDKVDVKDVSDISIIGADSDAELNGFGMKIWRAENIIVRNIKIHHVVADYEDAIQIDDCHHVWIDHCELYSDMAHDKDYYDGLLDIKNGSKYVTASWNYIHDHWKTSLIGHTDKASQMAVDTAFRVTYHHNYFHRTYSRNPSLRYGKLHAFNNYYKDIVYYCIVSRKGAKALIENNYFEDSPSPVSTTFGDSPDGFACLANNIYAGTSTEDENDISQTDCSWNVPYQYYPDSTESINTLVPLYSGTGILEFGAGGEPTNIFTLSVEITGSGSVSPNKGSFMAGTEVQLIARPEEDWIFEGWIGDVTGDNDTINFTIDTTMSIIAVFKLNTSVLTVSDELSILKLKQNYPNPFSDHTEIEFMIPENGLVKLSVYTVDGRKISEVINGYYLKGTYKTVLDRKNLKQGLYLYSLSFNNQSIFQKLIVK